MEQLLSVILTKYGIAGALLAYILWKEGYPKIRKNGNGHPCRGLEERMKAMEDKMHSMEVAAAKMEQTSLYMGKTVDEFKANSEKNYDNIYKLIAELKNSMIQRHN